jgi:hypothetical protein
MNDNPFNPGHNIRRFRADDGLWHDFSTAVALAGNPNRSDILRAFCAWYAHRPGAELPTRPATGTPTEKSHQ